MLKICLFTGNECRFVNHDCKPNAKYVKRIVKGRPAIGLVSLRSIDAEELITVNYGTQFFKHLGGVCQCNTCSSNPPGESGVRISKTWFIDPFLKLLPFEVPSGSRCAFGGQFSLGREESFC